MDKWSKYKACDKHRIKTPVSAQNLIEIKRISDDGIFEVGAGGIFTKTYELSDINYSLLSTEEKRRGKRTVKALREAIAQGLTLVVLETHARAFFAALY